MENKSHQQNHLFSRDQNFFKVPIAANWKGVCVQNSSKLHSYHLKKYGDYYDFLDR